jgi:hypothetical protein
MLLSDIVGLMLATAPVVGLLLWRERAAWREEKALIVRADVHASVTRELDGESLLAISVESPTAFSHGEIRLSTPAGYESLVGQALHAVLARTPGGYDVVITCGGGA